jgi:hypothetical protein
VTAPSPTRGATTPAESRPPAEALTLNAYWAAPFRAARRGQTTSGSPETRYVFNAGRPARPPERATAAGRLLGASTRLAESRPAGRAWPARDGPAAVGHRDGRAASFAAIGDRRIRLPAPGARPPGPCSPPRPFVACRILWSRWNRRGQGRVEPVEVFGPQALEPRRRPRGAAGNRLTAASRAVPGDPPIR